MSALLLLTDSQGNVWNCALQLHKVLRSRFLRPGQDQVFFCPFIVRIECCWIAKFDYEWVADLGRHRLMSCSVCPPIPGKDVQPEGVLCQELDDMLKHISGSEAVSLTDLLLMTGSASPTPGFHMLVQYVATLCHLQSVPVVQPQLRLHDQQTLDISQVRILAHGHKSLVVQLGTENAVYKVQCTCTIQSVSRVCALCTCTAQLMLLCCTPFALHCCTLSRTSHGDVKTTSCATDCTLSAGRE